MTFRLTGVQAMAKAMEKAAKNGRNGAVRGLELGARQVLDVSNSQVPHEVGDLERDGAASVDSAMLKAAVSYGRNAETAEYAVPQHERMDYRHDPGRNAKYLENAFNSEAGVVSQIIAEQTRKGLGT